MYCQEIKLFSDTGPNSFISIYWGSNTDWHSFSFAICYPCVQKIMPISPQSHTHTHSSILPANPRLLLAHFSFEIQKHPMCDPLFAIHHLVPDEINFLSRRGHNCSIKPANTHSGKHTTWVDGHAAVHAHCYTLHTVQAQINVCGCSHAGACIQMHQSQLQNKTISSH